MVSYQNHRANLVREMGLEPTRRLPHAPQTCLSTIPTLSQVLEYYNCYLHFCQQLFPEKVEMHSRKSDPFQKPYYFLRLSPRSSNADTDRTRPMAAMIGAGWSAVLGFPDESFFTSGYTSASQISSPTGSSTKNG